MTSSMPEHVTSEQLALWKALDKEATPGPWHSEVCGVEGDSAIAATGPLHKVRVPYDKVKADADFIAAAREAVPALIEEVELLWASASVQRMNDLHSETKRLIRELHEMKAEVERLRADLAYEKQLHKDASEEVERLRKDQDDWRKGVDLIRAPLVKFANKQLPTLCCVTISNAVLEVCAEVERLRASLAATDELCREWRDAESKRAVEVERLSAEVKRLREKLCEQTNETLRQGDEWCSIRDRRDALKALLRDVANSRVQFDANPPWRPYATVMINGELWAKLREEFGQ